MACQHIFRGLTLPHRLRYVSNMIKRGGLSAFSAIHRAAQNKIPISLITSKPSPREPSDRMKKPLSRLIGYLIGIYFLSFLVIAPYFNWQYAKRHGFIKWLFLGEIVATAKSTVWPYYIFIAKDPSSAQSRLENKLIEYTDNEYGYAFQFPSDWKTAPIPPKGEAGEVRVVLKSPKSTTLMTSVGKLETSISKQALANNPNSSAIVDAMIIYTIDSVYKKASRDIGSSRMVVAEKRAMPSEIAVKFYISTLHFIKIEEGDLPVALVGIHYIPFEKDYLITLLMTSPVDPKDTDGNETFTNILNSFHLVDEKPT